MCIGVVYADGMDMRMPHPCNALDMDMRYLSLVLSFSAPSLLPC